MIKMSEMLKDYIINKKHHAFRQNLNLEYAKEFKEKKLSPKERMAERFERLTRLEKPVILPGEKICFMRTVKKIPDIFTEDEWDEIRSKYFIHELDYMSNLSPNYYHTIEVGLLEKRKTADEYGKRAIDNIIALSDRYKEEAAKCGRDDIVKVLERVPRYGAASFREALQFFRILHYSLWLEGNYHNTVGRFDKYMYKYLKADMEKGIYDEAGALELIEDFFLSFNKDSDLYAGVQKGDNGQSMVLGGRSGGCEVFNLLSKLCLKASNNLLMIDPKINIRVGRNTPIEVYELGSELTKAGLGFPQYSNDDVVIDALIKLGYEPDDAENYVVAACWEFIIPFVGADVVNIGALSFPMAVDIAMHKYLKECKTFDCFKEKLKDVIADMCDELCHEHKKLWLLPSPFMNVLMDCDIYNGGKYNNFGFHGTGIATAADSLAVIKKYVYDEGSISKYELIDAVDSDFEKHADILPVLRYEAPKMGNNIEWVDDLAVWLLDRFADGLEGKTNCRGGIYRAGTGSAMFYLWHAEEIGASPDGRRRGEAFGTNFSPSLFANLNGPISIIKSFSKPHFERAINGGPLTMEFHSSMFTDPDCVKKVARLVKTYMDMGGHQMQLNTVNPDKLKDAQLHPENYRQLVVRIWGWSAYFVELDKAFQDHVMARHAYSL